MNKTTTIHDREREEQVRFGREMLKIKPQQKQHHKPQPKRQNLPSLKKTERKLTGHEAELAKAIADKTNVTLYFNSPDVATGAAKLTGKIVEFDKYAVKIELSDETSRWIFKSAMKGLSVGAR